MRGAMICLAFWCSMAAAGTPMAASANADRRQFPESDWPYVFYLVADNTTARLLGWVLSSTSRQPEIELCLPVQVQAGLLRIDIRNLGWRHSDWTEVLAAHPYGGFSLLVRGDWLLTEILDTQLSATRHKDGVASYYRLLYGAAVPKTEDEFLKFWEVDTDATRFRGHIEGKSKVNRRGRRWVENRSTPHRYFWFTRDSIALDSESDPLERPDGSFRHDGSEGIVGFQKYSARTFERGVVQAYYLADGGGKLVNEAPLQLVSDSTLFRGIASIRVFGACLTCHTKGLQPLEENALVQLSQEYETAVFSEKPEDLRRFHFGSLEKEIARGQEDYAVAVRLHTGWTGSQLADAVAAVIEGYDRPLDIGQAAEELGVSSSRLRDTIRHYGQANPVPAGIAMLAGGGECSRDLFEEQYQFLDEILRRK